MNCHTAFSHGAAARYDLASGDNPSSGSFKAAAA